MKKATVSSKEVRDLDLSIKRWLVAWKRVLLGGNSLAVPWLGLGVFTARAQVQSLWMWFGAFPGAFGLGRAQPQRRGTSP